MNFMQTIAVFMFLNRYSSTAAVVLVAIAAAVGSVKLGFGAALIGEPRRVEIPINKAVDGVETAKELYKRPSSIPFPKTNPYTPAKAALGKKLYFDPRLSASQTQSCATCHSPGLGWGDGLAVGVGHGMAKLGRRSPTIINVAWGEIFMWDGRQPDLEKQALGPIESADEMNMPIDALISRLKSIREYEALFTEAFPNEGLSPVTLARAIATYERTVVSERAPFDAWIDGDEKAISDAAKRGFAVFNGKGQCSSCHEGWNFTNDSFQDIGLPGKDVGRGTIIPGIVKMSHAFKTPGLREIANRGPYMHDGALATLEDVVAFYDSGGVDRDSRSDLMKPLGLTVQEKSELVAFMKTLSSDMTPTAVPVLPR